MNNKINLICNKCGTPIIHGENHCRFCGASDYSEKEYVKKYEEVEVIGFNEPEVIDFTTMEDDVTIPTPSEPAPAAPAAPAAPVTPVTPEVPAAPVAPAPVQAPAVPAASPMTEAPLEATGVLKKVDLPKNDLSDVVTFTTPAKTEEKSLVSESTPYVVTSPSEKKIEEVTEAIQKEQDKPLDEPINLDNPKAESRAGRVVGVVLLVFLLFVSVLLNIYLLVVDGATTPDEPKVTTSTTNQTAYLGNYKIESPNNWSTIIEDGRLVMMDRSEDWAASVAIKTGLTSTDVASNEAAIKEVFGQNKYSFSSDAVTDDGIVVFKGMYYSYVTYVIVRPIGTNTIAVVDLKFKGAVDNDIYESVVKTLKSITAGDTTSYFKNDFTFVDTTSLISGVLTKE